MEHLSKSPKYQKEMKRKIHLCRWEETKTVTNTVSTSKNCKFLIIVVSTVSRKDRWTEDNKLKPNMIICF